MVQLRNFAERLLFGPNLDDKLYAPDELSDERPGVAVIGLVEPTRTAGLSMASNADPFPGDNALADAGARGRALHFFADHELLALELMALALLRFPDAPPAFRRGLAATIRDEQRHLSLYVTRMRQLGTELGDVRLGGFFWRTIQSLESPDAFVAHMSLTFEQANLDHARRYADTFAAWGDSQTAAVMEEVYADEIRHVRLGVHWFREWHPDGPLIDAHRSALVPPVSLRRARGPRLDVAGRRAAGLPEDYVRAIDNVPTTRGKPPVVHLFDPTTELQLAHPQGYNADAATAARVADLECLPILYAAADDVVLVRRRPGDAFLAQLRGAGFVLPELVALDVDAGPLDVPVPTVARVEPWGWTPKLARRLQPLRRRAASDPVPAGGWPVDVFHKSRGVAVLSRLLSTPNPRLDDPASVGVVASDETAALVALEGFRRQGFSPIAIKAVLGTAGRGTIRVLPGPVPAAQRAWLAKTLARQGAVVVEPWRKRVCDLSLRLRIDAAGVATIDGVGRFLVDPRGQYLGAVVGSVTAGLPVDLVRFVHGDGKDPDWLSGVWNDVAEAVADELAPTGYVGLVGVDAIIVDCDGSFRLRPVVELNTRVHMGHVAVQLAKRVAPGRVGLWKILRHADLPDGGVSGFEPLARQAQSDNPIQLGVGGKISAGVVWTNDPARAGQVLSGLAVAASVERAEAMLYPQKRSPHSARLAMGQASRQ